MLPIPTHMPMWNLFGSMASSREKPGGQGSSPPPGLRELPPPPEPRPLTPAPMPALLTLVSDVTVVLIVKPQAELIESFADQFSPVAQADSLRKDSRMRIHTRKLTACATSRFQIND